MRKIYSKELKNEIIQWEEHCWKLFQKRMKPFCQKYKQKGVDIYLEQYWYNYNEKDSKENKTRIEFFPGYRYCCRYSFRKNGLIYKYFGNESACIFRKNCASVPEERSAIPLQTEQSSVG